MMCVSSVPLTIQHVVIVDGLRVECDTIGCNFVDYAPTYEDAQVMKEIHENGS